MESLLPSVLVRGRHENVPAHLLQREKNLRRHQLHWMQHHLFCLYCLQRGHLR